MNTYEAFLIKTKEVYETVKDDKKVRDKKAKEFSKEFENMVNCTPLNAMDSMRMIIDGISVISTTKQDIQAVCQIFAACRPLLVKF